jgi:hypothetical protein
VGQVAEFALPYPLVVPVFVGLSLFSVRNQLDCLKNSSVRVEVQHTLFALGQDFGFWKISPFMSTERSHRAFHIMCRFSNGRVEPVRVDPAHSIAQLKHVLKVGVESIMFWMLFVRDPAFLPGSRYHYG